MTSITPTDSASCLCCSGKPYADCCQPLHNGEQHALTAEQLMRSRYSAFATNNPDYLLATWDTSTRPKSVDCDLDNVQWQQLEIIETKKGTQADNKGVVHFKAYHTLNGKQQVLNEISRFVKKSSHWYYLDGTVKSIQNQNQNTNTGKNAPCSCGSGKKYKRCCGKT
ncbi:MAG TPA: zinc chelation protein SecC [Crenotrichaceae bacterium]|nr:zinc chelation protein SecC [Crenotrichaceae bacterium]